VNEHSDGTDHICVVSEANYTTTKTCVDAATRRLLSVDSNSFRSGTFQEHARYSDYQPFGTKMFPRTLHFHGWESQSIDIQVTKLAAVQAFAANEFTPPPGAERTPVCEHSTMIGHAVPHTGNSIPMGFQDIEVAMYFQVSEIGAVRYAQVVYSTSPLKNKEILNWFIGTHFPVKRCGDTPVSYELVYRLLGNR